MPVLARLRMGSIGCPAARFDPLDLELVGSDLRLRHTLFWLRNGGGKSSLISLILLLLNPKVGSTLGKTSKGEPKLETDYVVRGETGVVLAEWLPDHPGTGPLRRHVTFMAMQRGERDGKAEKGWVAATLPLDVDPAEVFQLHQLAPLAERGPERRGLSVEALLRRAREVSQAHRDWEIVTVASHEPGRWLDHLRAIGIDSGLAMLLTRMNLEEGDLAKALTFASAEEFVAQAARLLAPPEDMIRDLQRGIVAWAADHRGQADRRLAREELLRVRPVWEALVQKGQAREAAREKLKEQAFEALALLEGVAGAEPDVVERRMAAERALAEAESARDACAEARERLEGEAAAAGVSLAGTREEEARRAAEIAQARSVDAEREKQLARATVPAVLLAASEMQLQALQAQRAARRTEAEPRFRRRDALALTLGALSEGDQARAASVRDEAKMERNRAREAGRVAQSQVDDLGASEAGARAELVATQKQLQAAQTAVAALVKDGLLLAREALGEGRARAEAGRDAAEESVSAAQSAVAESRATLGRSDAEAKAQGVRLTALATEHRQVTTAIASALSACEGLASRIEELRFAELGRPSLPDQADMVLDVVRTAHREAVVRHAEERSRLAGLEVTCESLRARDLLPAPADVRRVTEAAGLSPALDYLRSNLGDRTGDALRAVPGLAHGAVATSAALLGRAREVLERLELEVDVPVPVFLAAELTPEALARQAQAAVAPQVIVGLAPHASVDARNELLDRRTAERERVRRHEHELRERATQLEELLSDATDLLARFGATFQAEQRARLEALDNAIKIAAEAKAHAQREAEQARSQLAEREARLKDAQSTRKRAHEALQRLTRSEAAHAEALAHGPDSIVRLEALVTKLGGARAESIARRDEANRNEQSAIDREVAAEQARKDAEQRARDFLGLVEQHETTPAEVEDPASAEAELRALHRELVAGEAAVEAEHGKLKLEIEKHRRLLEKQAKTRELTHLARERAAERSEAQAREEEEAAIKAATQAAAEAASTKSSAEDAAKRLVEAKRTLSALEGLAREAAAAWVRPEQSGALEAFLAAVPSRRKEADAELARTNNAVSSSAGALRDAIALVKTWAQLVDDARDAWDTARAAAPDLEAAIRASVREDRNARMILDPAAQAPKLLVEAKACAKAINERMGQFLKAESDWLSAADRVILTATASTSETVRRFATVRLPAGDPANEGGEEMRHRAVAMRAAADLELLDREVEDIVAQLADVERTLSTLAGQLADLVTRLAGRVRDLERASVLPEGLGAWSKQHFLSIDLPLLDAEQLTLSLEKQLVTWADGEKVPSVRDLVPQALAAGLAGQPSVSMPKADRFDRWTRRRPIAQIGKDSGGEALTAAFILFCILARVVAGGSRREKRVTLALIDNPFGTANRFDFVEAQCVVAAAFGVQYLAATGISDHAVTERFERLITLSNPSQHRVEVKGNEDQGIGRPVDAVLWARDEVLLPAGGTGRTWPEAAP